MTARSCSDWRDDARARDVAPPQARRRVTTADRYDEKLFDSIEPMSVPTEEAAPAGMRDAHEKQGLIPYIKDVWERRSYIWYVSASEVRSRRVDTVLGNFWHVLTPILTVTVYYVVFGLLLNITRGVDNLILYLAVGVFLFGITQQSTIRGSNSIISNSGMINSIRFPRVILPFTSVMVVWLSNMSTLAVMYAIAILTGEPIRAQWLLLLPIAALLTVFNAGAAMIAARATTHFRDTTQILPVIFRLLFYGSGVIFNVEAYAEGREWIIALFTLNPLYGFITMARWTLLGGDSVTLGVTVSVVVWTIVLFVGGFTWSRAGEQEYARD